MRTALVTILIIVSTLFSACGTQNAENEMQDKPFKGVWQFIKEPEVDEPTGRIYGKYTMVLAIDFYEESVDNGMKKTHGGFFVENDRGSGDCEITSFTIDGNTANIEYADLSGATFSATLLYSPSDKTMKFIDGEVIDKQDCEDYMIGQFHYLRNESVLNFTRRDITQTPDNNVSVENERKPMGTFGLILGLIVGILALVGIYYLLKIILFYVATALVGGLVLGLIGLIAGHFISEPNMYTFALVAAIIGAVIGLIIAIFGTNHIISTPFASGIAKDLSKSDPNGTEYIARDQYGNTTKVKKTGRGILGETYYEDEDGNTYQKP